MTPNHVFTLGIIIKNNQLSFIKLIYMVDENLKDVKVTIKASYNFM